VLQILLVNSSNIGASSTQSSAFGIHGPTSGTQGPTFGEPTKKRKKEAKIKRLFKEIWATQFP
jgi:hypothetical protein